jgi:integrase
MFPNGIRAFRAVGRWIYADRHKGGWARDGCGGGGEWAGCCHRPLDDCDGKGPRTSRGPTARAVLASTQNQALAAVLFLYAHVLETDLGHVGGIVHAKAPVRLPVVLTREEVGRVMAELKGTMLVMASLLYGSGLRVMECAGLRVKDLDFGAAQILVRRGRGQVDRATLLLERRAPPS